LDIKKRYLQYITYCSETFTIENSLNNKGVIFDSPSKIFESWKNLKNSAFAQRSSLESGSGNLPAAPPSGLREKGVAGLALTLALSPLLHPLPPFGGLRGDRQGPTTRRGLRGLRGQRVNKKIL
jgi:hypothetical protein